jgi:hypothetical protein
MSRINKVYSSDLYINNIVTTLKPIDNIDPFIYFMDISFMSNSDDISSFPGNSHVPETVKFLFSVDVMYCDADPVRINSIPEISTKDETSAYTSLYHIFKVGKNEMSLMNIYGRIYKLSFAGNRFQYKSVRKTERIPIRNQHGPGFLSFMVNFYNHGEFTENQKNLQLTKVKLNLHMEI